MIVSKYSKSYDTADGSEQYFKDRHPPIGNGDVQRVEVVRAGAAESVAARTSEPPPSSLEFAAKPTWSVQSLRDLNLAVRLGDWPDNPDHARRLAVVAERASVTSAELEARRISARAHAQRYRDRNPWENT
jgi:hypothetical protein